VSADSSSIDFPRVIRTLRDATIVYESLDLTRLEKRGKKEQKPYVFNGVSSESFDRVSVFDGQWRGLWKETIIPKKQKKNKNEVCRTVHELLLLQ